MYQLSTEEIEYIQSDLTRSGIRTQGLRDNLLDHICILLEDKLQHSDEFEAVYRIILSGFYIENLRELEGQTRLLELSRHHLILTKLQFFIILFILLLFPFIVYLANHITFTWFGIETGLTKNLWGPVLAYAVWPISSLLVLFLIPDRLDPPIQRRAKIFIGMRPVIAVENI